jgi:hypothetical protein
MKEPRISLGAPVIACAIAIAALGCDKSGGSGAEVSSAPSRAGEVWEIDRVADRAAAPAAVAAYVNGLHVMVLDGDDAYAGMTRLRATAGGNGARVLKLASGGEVQLASAGDAIELRFSGGESIPLRKQQRTERK